MQVEEFIDSILTEPDKFTYYYGVGTEKLVWRHKNLDLTIIKRTYYGGHKINYILTTRTFYGWFTKRSLVPQSVINHVSHHIESMFEECRNRYQQNLDSIDENRFFDALTKS